MKKDSTSIEMTSRRQFTRTMVTAAFAAPIVASIAGCQTASPTNTPGATPTAAPTGGPSPSPTASPTAQTGTGGVHPQEPCPCKATIKNGYTEISFGGPGGPEEHIPPMRIEGGGSLTIDSKNKLKKTGSGPYNYVEDGVDPGDQYGNIEQAMVITETEDEPYLSTVIYVGFQQPTQLWLWYQDISKTPADPDDTTFPSATFPDNDPDIRFVGGKGSNLFKIAVKRKKLDEAQSHKKNRPHRYKHGDGGGMARHFRIGQWRLVDSAGTTLVGHSGAENYTFHVKYGDFQPKP